MINRLDRWVGGYWVDRKIRYMGGWFDRIISYVDEWSDRLIRFCGLMG